MNEHLFYRLKQPREKYVTKCFGFDELLSSHLRGLCQTVVGGFPAQHSPLTVREGNGIVVRAPHEISQELLY